MHQSDEAVEVSPITLHDMGDTAKGEMCKLSQTFTLETSMNLLERQAESTNC
jgi:hypothetical protein